MMLLIIFQIINWSKTNKQLYYLRQRLLARRVNICRNRMKMKKETIVMQTKKCSYDIFISHIVGSVTH